MIARVRTFKILKHAHAHAKIFFKMRTRTHASENFAHVRGL